MDFFEEELEYEKRFQVKPVVKECIYELLERFWVLRSDDQELFYEIKDNEEEIKAFFRDTFHFRLISNYDMIKLEKIPVSPKEWMGEKINKDTPVFKSPKDFAFFFFILGFLEGKNNDQQFSLQNICEYMQIQYGGELVWKGGLGYQNRLSFVRTLKYAVKMRLLKVVDQEIEDFLGDDGHDVLLQREPNCSYFMRIISEDVTNWEGLEDALHYVEKENYEIADKKNRYYRRLFLEPIVYHKDLLDEEKNYVSSNSQRIEDHLYRYTNYIFEKYKNCSLLVKENFRMSEKVFPSENMIAKLVMLIGNQISQSTTFEPNNADEIEITKIELDQQLIHLKKTYRQFWTKRVKDMSIEELRNEVLSEMKKWDFAEELDRDTFIIKDGLFRITGNYFDE